MPELTLGELKEATGGLLMRGNPDVRVHSFEIDTRRLKQDSLFFALKGTKTDGHRFLSEAATRGAVAAVIGQESADIASAPESLIRVDDVVTAMGRCAAYVRNKLNHVKWVAITGSNGKTTTKEMLAAGLSGAFRVHRTAGNLNNHLGVPLTLLACPDDAEIAVIELAMSSAGEIGYLAHMSDPDVGLVTNVRAAHLEFFNSLDDIAAAKGELFGVMRDDATSVVNLDDMHVRVQSMRHNGPRVTFGKHAGADLCIERLDNRFFPGTAFSYRQGNQVRQLQLRIGGAHSAFNALAALAGIHAVGGDLDAAGQQIERLEAGTGRGRIHRLARNVMLVDDCYNSSPSALASVLDTMKLSEPQGRKFLVMGDMLELGSLEGAMHREAGKRAAAAGVQVFVAVGALARSAAESARRSGVPEVHHYGDSKQAAQTIPEMVRDGDLIVVKGSRGVRLGRVVRALTSVQEEVR